MGQAGLVGVIGPACSSAAVSALPILEDNGIVAISPSSTVRDVPSYGPSIFNRIVLHEGQPGSEEGAEADDLPSVQAFYGRLDVTLSSRYRFFAAYAYDATMILLKALERVGQVNEAGELTVDRASLAQEIRNTQSHAGITGTISFDEEGNRER